MLFIEQPVGVGFSYGDRYRINCTHINTYLLICSLTHSNVDIGANNDDNTALRNVQAVEAFYEMFPEYLTNKFYISGESYAGMQFCITQINSLTHSLTL